MTSSGSGSPGWPGANGPPPPLWSRTWRSLTRRLYLGDGYPSLFAWCTRALRYSEHEAYLRIEVARAARRFPDILDRLADGSVHLTAVSLLAPHLTAGNHEQLIDAARHRTKREVEELVATLRPAAEAPNPRARIVPLPCGGSDGAPPAAAPSGPAPGKLSLFQVALPGAAGPESASGLNLELSTPASPAPEPTWRLHVTLPKRTLERLDRARDLMRHQVPDGDAALILDRALELLIERLERRKFAALMRR